MLSAASFPPTIADVAEWFGTHDAEWNAGRAYRFAIFESSRMIGLVDVDDVADGEGVLGYWLERSAWGKGFASEAAGALLGFAFAELGLLRVRAGHAADNPASGHVLTKLGFRPIGRSRHHSRARNSDIEQCLYRLDGADYRG